MSRVVKYLEKWEPFALLVGMWMGATILGNNLPIPSQIKQIHML